MKCTILTYSIIGRITIMGANVLNLNLFCDYATPEKYSAIELHMELPVSHNDFRRIQNWLDLGEWETAKSYLVEKYPQHRALPGQRLAASQARNEGALTPPGLAAAN